MKWFRTLTFGGLLLVSPAFGRAADEAQSKPTKAAIRQSVGRIAQVDVEQRQVTLTPQTQQVQVQQTPGKEATSVMVFAVSDVTLIGIAGDKGIKGRPDKPKPNQDEPSAKPKPKPDQDQVPVKPKPNQDEPPTKPKPNPDQDQVTVKPKPNQDEPPAKPKPKPDQDQVTAKPKPNQDEPPAKPKPKPDQNQVTTKTKPDQEQPQQFRQSQFAQLRVGQIVRIRYEQTEVGQAQKAVEIQVLKDAE